MSSSRPELTVRTPTEADAAAIAVICNAIARDLYGGADEDEATIRSWFRLSDIGMFVAERDGRAVAYADVQREADGAKFPIDVRVAPEAREPRVAAALFEASEGWARERARSRAVARAYVADRDTYLADAIVHAGFRPIRHSFQMLIDLPEDLPDPAWPTGIAVRTYDAERDENDVYECTQEAFADGWDFTQLPIEAWRERTVRDESRFDPTLWWLAEDDGQLAGVCLNDWHFSGDPHYGWIMMLGVRRPWRRRGLGLALLRHSFADFARRGAKRVGLGVDGENTTGAVRLYERAGMRPARRTDVYEKPL